MKKLLLLLAFIAGTVISYAQCTTSNATTCQCKDGTTNCDLLPNIEIGHPPFYQTGTYGIIEYSQTGNGVDDGRLKVTVSTPNTGHGPLELRAQQIYICGTDTFTGTAPSICPDGITYPRQLIKQRIYHKTGSFMSYTDRDAGTMTYHPSHGHMHVDDWGTYTLRTDNGDPDPLNWPLIGAGAKLAFCVMDYGDCTDTGTYPDHCLDSAGNVLDQQSDFPNFGLGGGGYNCSPTVQGISSGYLDIYWTSLDGMWIDIPPGVCNGDYYLVVEVDPNQNFLEEFENDNFYVAPYTLTKQTPNTANGLGIVANGIRSSEFNICDGSSATLSFDTAGITSFNWSTGATMPTINVSQAGDYTVSITTACGAFTLDTISVSTLSTVPPSVDNDTIPVPGTAVLNATGTGTINWYDALSGGNLLGTGATFNTPFINNTTSFWAENLNTASNLVAGGVIDNGVQQGSYSTTSNSLIFDVFQPIMLNTVTVYSSTGGSRTVELRDGANTLINSATFTLVTGANDLNLNWAIPSGTGYQISRTGGELFRNNPGSSGGTMNYPYTVPGVVSITSSTQGDGYYYFFYNWQISYDVTCPSPRTEVQVVVISTSLSPVNSIEAIRIFPNPASGNVNISFALPGSHQADVSLMNMLGEETWSQLISSANGLFTKTIDVSGLSKGVYMLHIKSNDKTYYHRLTIQ